MKLVDSQNSSKFSTYILTLYTLFMMVCVCSPLLYVTRVIPETDLFEIVKGNGKFSLYLALISLYSLSFWLFEIKSCKLQYINV